MVRKQRFAAIVSTGLMVGALLACKKKPEAAPEPSAAVPTPPAPATAAPTPAATPPAADTGAAPTGAAPKLGDVKRYGVEKESKLDEAGVRVAADDVKVFNEADSKTPEVATLPKGLLVFRLVKVDDFQLVEFPSGIGQFSKGWVEAKGLTDSPEKVTRDAALNQKKSVNVKLPDGGAPAPSPSGSAAPAPSPSGSAAPKPTADKLTPPPPPPPKKKDDKKKTDKKKTEEKK